MSFLERKGILTGRIEETTEKQRVAGKYLSSKGLLDWYTELTIDEIFVQERLEMYADLLKKEGIEIAWLQRYCEKHKRLRVSTDRKGREEMVRLFRPEVVAGETPEAQMRRRRTLREKLGFGRG